MSPGARGAARRTGAAILLAALLAAAAGTTGRGAEAAGTDAPLEQAAATAERGHRLAERLSAVVGTALSPLLGVGILGVSDWVKADAAVRQALPWHARPWFWGTVLALLVLVAVKDTLGAAVPPLKKPLDALEVVENGITGLVAIPVLVAEVDRELGGVLSQAAASLGAGLAPVARAATEPPVAALVAPADLAWGMAFGVVAAFAYAVAWLVGHAVNVLVLLSPFPFLDGLLKAFRAVVVLLVFAAAMIHPLLGLLVSGLVILACLWLAAWSLRLTVFGFVMAWDLLTFRRAPRADPSRGCLAFSASGIPGVPSRTVGRLRREADAGLSFSHRPWLVRRRRTTRIPGATHLLGRGLLSPVVLARRDDGVTVTACRLAPRWRGAEAELEVALGLSSVPDRSVGAGLASAWQWIRGGPVENDG